jgi:hypothetical protein
MGTHVAGITASTVPLANGRNEVYGDAYVFRLDRWIVYQASVTEEEVAPLKASSSDLIVTHVLVTESQFSKYVHRRFVRIFAKAGY